MFCTHTQHLNPLPFEPEAAELYIREWFRADFLSRHPDGIVISQLEYMGGTTRARKHPSPVIYKGKSRINDILDALTSDFRRGIRNGDYRKCDVLGIANDGFTGELVEVTTEGNRTSAITQINAKLDTLIRTVNRVSHLHVDWRASKWRPSASQMYAPLSSTVAGQRYVCYQPTFRRPAPDGVILYEIHSTRAEPSRVPQRFKQRARSALVELKDMDQKAKEFLRDNSDVSDWIKGLLPVLAGAAVVATIVAAIDPIPGDEFVVGSFATTLSRMAAGQ